MNSLEQTLISIKNPHNAFAFSQKHNFWVVPFHYSDSFVWVNYLQIYYQQYIHMKNKNISNMDYYVLLYFLEQTNLLTDTFLIKNVQLGLASIPRIYENDHLAIIHFTNSIAFRLKYTNLVLYRKEFGDNKGKLECYFSEIENYRIQYTNKCPNIKNSKNKYCNPETGEIINLYTTDDN